MTESVNEIQFQEQADYYTGALADSVEFIRTFLLNTYPDLDLQPTRALYDLLLRPGAELNAYNQTNINHYRNAASLELILENPEFFLQNDVNRILGNFLLSRSAGKVAVGNVTIILSDNFTVSVPTNTAFTIAGLSFVAPATLISTPGALTTPFDRKLTPLSDGTWSFTIDLEAVEVGEKYQVKQGTAVTWNVPPSGYVRAYVESDFTGGADAETNTDMVARLDKGLAAKAMAGRINIVALLQDVFPAARDISIVGMGDSEMLRDSHNIFGISTGGKSDIYVRTSNSLIEQTLTKSCVLIDWANKVFQTSIARDDYPGFYFVQRIYPITANELAGGLTILSESRGVDMTDLDYVAPDLEGLVESAYTRFQTAVVQFEDPTADVTDLSVGDTVDYKFEISGIPLIDDIQDYVAGRSVRNPQGDSLVRAPIPMLVAITMQIDYVTGDAAVDVDAVKNAVATAVNAIDFSLGRVPSSLVVDAAHDVLKGRANVHEPINMLGVLRLPSGESKLYRSNTQLTVPEIVEEGVSSRNVSFYTDASAINVTVVTVETKSV